MIATQITTPGSSYFKGDVVEKDADKAVQYYLKAVKKIIPLLAWRWSDVIVKAPASKKIKAKRFDGSKMWQK